MGRTKPTHNLPIRILLALFSVALASLFLGYEWLMLQWPLIREAHFLHYIAYLINEHNFVPYRDVLETSWFGTLLFHMAIGKIFGYTAIDFRCADILFLALLLLVTWKILRHLDIWLAWIGTLSFGLLYLHYGPANTLQRDYVLLLPVATALFIALQTQRHPDMRAFIIGACFGAAASIKPHAAIGLPAIMALLYSQSGELRSWLRQLCYCVIGGCTSFGAGLLWLWKTGGLSAFIDMSLDYLPLYQELNGAHQMTTAAERWQNTLHWWSFFLWKWPYLVTTALIYGYYNTEKSSQQRALVYTLVALTICYNIYPLISGKFWDYHWIPYSYFAMLSSAVLIMPPRSKTTGSKLLSLTLILYFFYALSSQYFPGRGLQDQINRYPDITIDQTFEADVAKFIRLHLQPGETIQPIDQGGPSTLYLLQSGAPLATPYLGSFLFLHHIHEPYVQNAQAQFLNDLQTKPPKLFLVMTDFTRPSGPDTIPAIPQLQEFLQAHYQVIWKHPTFTFWEYTDKKISAEESP